MDGGATPCPSPLLWPRAPLTQCRKVQAVKGERPLAVPVGAAHLSGGPGPQGSRESSASNGCGVEPGEGGRVSAPQGRSGVAEKRGGGVVCWTAWAKNRLSGARTRLSLSLSVCLSPAACLQTSSRAFPFLSGATISVVLPFPLCYTASDLRPAETTRRT